MPREEHSHDRQESRAATRRAILAGTAGLAAGAVGMGLLRPQAAAAAATTSAWFNVKDPAYGAKGDGVTDDSPFIQAALNAAYNAGGGTVYLPAGDYLLGSGLTWGSDLPSPPATPPTDVPSLTIVGDGTGSNAGNSSPGNTLLGGGTTLHMNPVVDPVKHTASMTALRVFQATSFSMRDIAIFNEVDYTLANTTLVGAQTWITPNDMIAVDVGIHANFPALSTPVSYVTVGWAHFERVFIAAGPRSNDKHPDCCLKVQAGTSYLADCDIRGQTFGVWMTGGKVMTMVGCAISTEYSQVDLNQFPTLQPSAPTKYITPVSAGIVMDNGAQTLRITNCLTARGDAGLWLREPASTSAANGIYAFTPNGVYANDFEVNNAGWAGIQLDAGGSFWGSQLWLSAVNLMENEEGKSVANTICHGMTVGANFSGLVAVMGSKISNWGGHGVWILGGAGYTISGSSIGRCGSNSPSTFDGIHVENTGVADINICDCHFDVDPTNSPYSKYPSLPQYAIFVGAGTSNYRITNNIFASAASAHYVNTGGPNNTPVAIGDANPTDTACPAYSGNIGPLADYWTTVTLPSAAASGFIRYAARPDRKLEFQFSLVNPSGIVTSPLSSPLNLAGALPGQVLPSGLRPAQDFRGAAPGIWSASPVTTVRFQVTTGGGVNILGIPSSGVVTEIDGHYIIPLT